ncbi:HEAT repeat domain-containing protein [Natranaerofaba carboxydovora]|uniref:HEAT repeat domain-containing protein n=1 Tax=Natranaerofaba carboxydovora TaxID=2742683 RepID=UPI001F13EEF1|nr:HEAT repeat domain-containing protein [Natranaerofaba carboxydovora]UMZ72668.1 HEAT repeat-containing protein [Natranaerofaba carboxydovora]
MSMFNSLLILIVIMTIAIIGLLLFILLNHYLLWRREKVYQQNKDEWEDTLYSYLADDISIDKAALKMKGDYYNLWRLLTPYLTNLKGDDREKIVELVKEIGMTDYFLNIARKSKRRKKRVSAISALGKIGEKRVSPFLKNMLNSKDTIEMTFAAKAIADIGETNLILPVFRRMLTDTYTTFEGITEIAVRFGEDICPPIKNIIQEWFDGKRDLEESFGVSIDQSLSLLVDILGYYRYTVAGLQLEKILEKSDNSEVIIHVLKALSTMGYPVKISLNPFIDHENWIIRSQATKYIGKIKEDTYKEKIKQLLDDENWWVRFYAAQALYNLGEVSYLESNSSFEDRKGEISRYILSKA